MNENKEKSSIKPLITLIVSSGFFGIILVPAFWIAMSGVMLFDSPGSTESGFLITLYAVMLSFPFVILISFTSWIFFYFEKYKWAVIVSLFPLINVLSALILIFISYVFFNGSLIP